MYCQIRNALTTGGILLTVVVLLTGCNTTAGIGKDVTAVGQAVTTEAQEVQQGL